MQPGMVVSEETFRNHIKWLARYLNVIRLTDFKEKNFNTEQPACVITLDDGWVDNYTYAYPILKEFKIPATIFLVTNMIDTEHYFWPERLGLLLKDAAAKASLKKQVREKYASELVAYDDLVQLLKSKDDESIIGLLDEVEKEAESSGRRFESERQILNKEELAEMEASGLVEYGSHTANHIRLDKVPARQALHEITESKNCLDALLTKPVSTFCYPNGGYTSEVVDAVAGIYDLACTTDNGWVNVKSNRYTLNRVMLHDDISNAESLFWGRVLGFF
ncbi:Polysaccharide deacetylase [hydrothermal vent metagenome]|uniref:Polysaccharide deacetylase n=1 Tax=hydrothermal vent metagenome TaxID=652676 RepID=A0A3B0ZWK0_9ZZZZ